MSELNFYINKHDGADWIFRNRKPDRIATPEESLLWEHVEWYDKAEAIEPRQGVCDPSAKCEQEICGMCSLRGCHYCPCR